MWTDSQKIGVALTAFGVFFMFLGVITFFDAGLLAIGNILFITGIPLTIGTQRTIVFFSQKSKIRGTICFLIGISLVFCKWTIIGMLVEIFGILNLFGDFFPLVFAFLRRLPIIGSVLNHPGIEKIFQQFSSSSVLPV
ncbi:putative GOT1-membrane protein required for ER to Golgi transport [Halteromyces radiatus]|uniref:putative GOT1-membrane protein required for ER to Golgi transport n=1 Tax=Halteromyces radiatus TaxID=101107 RepID=UPI00222024E0|nr:putative GOT1-membrane protein required for ER to Golgi transport [Halteromyces radiatus]KAI8099813.1 putative GOT1-membrane protein required for ER to Golgi transport [Halteromyces radiatus]